MNLLFFNRSSTKLIEYREAHLNRIYKIFENLDEETHILTGSSILLLNYIDREVHDIDILIRNDNEFMSMRSGMIDNFKVQFIETNQYHNLDYTTIYNPVNKKYIKCHSIQHVLHSKIQLNRHIYAPKHLTDMQLIRSIFDYESEINKNV